MRATVSCFLSFFVTLACGAAASAQTLPTAAAAAVNIALAADGSQGGNPYSGIIQASDGNLYGTVQCGGDDASALSQCQGNYDSAAGGAVFRITPSGTYSLLHTFAQAEGAVPQGLVEAPDGNLYGTAVYGGAYGHGDVFRMSLTDGTVTVLKSFEDGSDSENPSGSIIYGDDGYLYATNVDFESGAGEGTLWRIKTDGTGFQVLWTFGTSGGGSAENFGLQPYDGVEKIGNKLYGVSSMGAPDGYGAVWYVDASTLTGVTLYDFTNGADGAGPANKPHLAADGNLYGTTPQRTSNTTYGGSVYRIGQSSGFKELINNANAYFYGGIAFDNNGFGLYSSELPQQNTNGSGLYAASVQAASPKQNNLFVSTDATYGYFPSYTPFIDNKGRVWTEPIFGGNNNPFGSVVAFTTTPAESSPITIAASPATLTAGGSTSITWAAHNAFSSNEQVCFASGAWSGLQTGTLSGGVFSSRAATSVTLAKAGTYTFAITCGGSESALATVTVTAPAQSATSTTVTASHDPVVGGGNVTLTATVKKTSGTGAPTGNVAFSAGGETLATVAVNGSGVASLTGPASFPNGTYAVTATYSGDSADKGSSGTVNVSIRDASKTSLAIAPSTVKSGGSATISIAVTGSGPTPTGNVNLQLGSTVLATVGLSGGKVSFAASTSGYPAGTYSLTAVYAGDSNYVGSTSSAVTVTITQ